MCVTGCVFRGLRGHISNRDCDWARPGGDGAHQLLFAVCRLLLAASCYLQQLVCNCLLAVPGRLLVVAVVVGSLLVAGLRGSTFTLRSFQPSVIATLRGG